MYENVEVASQTRTDPVHLESYARQVTQGFEQPHVRASQVLLKIKTPLRVQSTQLSNCLREMILYNRSLLRALSVWTVLGVELVFKYYTVANGEQGDPKCT